MNKINSEILNRSLFLLNSRLKIMEASLCEIVVCGGSSLIAMNLAQRETTKDVDIVAMRNENKVLIDPDPLPDDLIKAAETVRQTLNLPESWFNTGPADIFRMGFPAGFEERLILKKFGDNLNVYFISRLDQIHFKLYASVDRGGYHIEDLLALEPTDDELIRAGQWTRTHDVSEGYRQMLKSLLSQLGYVYAAERV